MKSINVVDVEHEEFKKLKGSSDKVLDKLAIPNVIVKGLPHIDYKGTHAGEYELKRGTAKETVKKVAKKVAKKKVKK